MSMESKTTAPISPVGASGEQSQIKNSNEILTKNANVVNGKFSKIDNFQEIMQQMNDPAYMPIVSLNELLETVYPNNPPIIDGLLYSGTYIFAGAPKVGKSFLMAQIAYHVATGIPLWNYPTQKSKVLYLALEDNEKRLQHRLSTMFGVEGTDDLIFTTEMKQLGRGLDEQLQGFMRKFPETKLIIIDTLQKIRESGGDSYSYASDYDIIARLKCFASSHNLCLLLVHHTRKQRADDRMEKISGTNGLLGAADGGFVLSKEKRTDNRAILEISGRDQPDQEIHLIRNEERLIWEFEKAETELWKAPPDPMLEKIAKLVGDGSWQGSPTELAEKLEGAIQSHILTKWLNVRADRLINDYKIHYEKGRKHDGRFIKLEKILDTA